MIERILGQVNELRRIRTPLITDWWFRPFPLEYYRSPKIPEIHPKLPKLRKLPYII